jgi:15-cis-phytoene synthase
MSLQSQAGWEYRLHHWAYTALHTPASGIHIEADETLLAAAYRHCDELTATHSRTFYIASALLSQEKRRAVRALYAFCRVTDNIIDNPGDIRQRQRELETWRDLTNTAHILPHQPVALAWMDTQRRFNIPNGYSEQLICGCERDLYQTRYETFADLAEYSYGVASTVGLMAMHIIGFQGEIALPQAVKLGVALQITNILRDIAEDWQAGRFYLPLQELKDFGLSEADIERGQVDDRWREFMRFQIKRNRRLYTESLPGITLLDPDGRFAIAAAAELYQAILTAIEDHDYNIFNRRAYIGLFGKLSRLPKIWWYSRRGFK